MSRVTHGNPLYKMTARSCQVALLLHMCENVNELCHTCKSLLDEDSALTSPSWYDFLMCVCHDTTSWCVCATTRAPDVCVPSHDFLMCACHDTSSWCVCAVTHVPWCVCAMTRVPDVCVPWHEFLMCVCHDMSPWCVCAVTRVPDVCVLCHAFQMCVCHDTTSSCVCAMTRVPDVCVPWHTFHWWRAQSSEYDICDALLIHTWNIWKTCRIPMCNIPPWYARHH